MEWKFCFFSRSDGQTLNSRFRKFDMSLITPKIFIFRGEHGNEILLTFANPK